MLEVVQKLECDNCGVIEHVPNGTVAIGWHMFHVQHVSNDPDAIRQEMVKVLCVCNNCWTNNSTIFAIFNPTFFPELADSSDESSVADSDR